jgi:hypothetical protein
MTTQRTGRRLVDRIKEALEQAEAMGREDIAERLRSAYEETLAEDARYRLGRRAGDATRRREGT